VKDFVQTALRYGCWNYLIV